MNKTDYKVSRLRRWQCLVAVFFMLSSLLVAGQGFRNLPQAFEIACNVACYVIAVTLFIVLIVLETKISKRIITLEALYEAVPDKVLKEEQA